MNWTALLPLKLGPERKTRLARELSETQRLHLSQRMAAHVIATLRHTPEIVQLCVLAPTAPLDPDLIWVRDKGRGLNIEIAAFRKSCRPRRLLIIHGDLPFVEPADIQALLRSAHEKGAALAPDRHASGTNALALADERPFKFAFGANSRARHIANNSFVLMIVQRLGLQHDIDTLADLDAAVAAGFDPGL